jgi:uncharacterized membrane protein
MLSHHGFLWFGPLLVFGGFGIALAFAGRRWRRLEPPLHHGPHRPSALAILEERFARGEIDAEELRTRRQELLPRDDG